MPSAVALIIYSAFVIVLLVIERQRNSTASLALWLPTIWMLILGSRPVGRWFDVRTQSYDNDPAGSLLDQLVLGTLILGVLVVVFRRKIDWSRILRDNFWLIILILYMGISILWSEIPFASFKRLMRSAGDILMALAILSERMPRQALESVLRRCTYVLIPVSSMLIHYFPIYGRGYGHSSGIEAWTGVTLHKSSLGPLCAISAFFMTWSLLQEWRRGTLFKSKFQNSADALVLLMALIMLKGPGISFSATAVGMLIVSLALLLVLSSTPTLARHIGSNLKVFMIIVVSLYLVLYDSIVEMSASIFERDQTLTGRLDYWRPLMDFASHSPIFGVGYGGFWAPGNPELEELFTSQFILANAHNGYLAVYVELGIFGIVLLALFVLEYCGKVGRELDHEPHWAVFGICFLIMSLLYNNTETGFLQAGTYFWTLMVFLAIHCTRQSLPTSNQNSIGQPYFYARSPPAFKRSVRGAANQPQLD
jgi:exopolysaccharide production protein ExoQ